MKVTEENRDEDTATENVWLDALMHTLHPSTWKVKAGLLSV